MRIAIRRWRWLSVAVLFAAGCATFSKRDVPPPVSNEPRLKETPTAAQLVAYLDSNAAMLPAVEARDLDIDIKAGSQSFGVGGTMFVQQPKNFRLQVKQTVMGEVADVGSNDQEFWFWTKEDKYLYHCSHTDLARGVRLPFPIQPEWVMEALGLAKHDPNSLENFRVEMRGASIELIESAKSPQGELVQKVTVFRNGNATGNVPQVTGMKLLDANNKPVCIATIESVHRFQIDERHVAVLPHRVKLEWPAYQMSLKITLPNDGLKLNGNANAIATRRQIFTRPEKRDIKSYDLARNGVDAPALLQRTAGTR